MREVHDVEVARHLLEASGPLGVIVFNGLDLRSVEGRLSEHEVEGAVFLGCKLSHAVIADVVCRGALVFPRIGDLPFDPYRNRLYTPDELFEGFDPTDPCTYCDTPDAQIYRHWALTGRQFPSSVLEALARRLHDHAMTDAMETLLEGIDAPVVAVMGGHSMERDHPRFAAVARMSRTLAEKGFFLVSGGGPGAMEATHVGAHFAHRDDAELADGLRILAEAPSYKDREWLAAAFRAREAHPVDDRCGQSLGIPTFLYGHEPPNLFATHVAKYFANSVREDGLISVASHGIVYAPGSAGTIQEIFQDAAQNHYGTVEDMASPMVFLDTEYWTREKPIYPVLEALAEGHVYGKLIHLTDDVDDAVRFLEENAPREVPGGGWSFCGAHCAE
ncbi:MAG: hypothetical protein JJ863_38835 [Deltaproteobacteria bacterium]|nr:hypothetical protein [Deltaproteobacteria bacterium]